MGSQELPCNHCPARMALEEEEEPLGVMGKDKVVGRGKALGRGKVLDRGLVLGRVQEVVDQRQALEVLDLGLLGQVGEHQVLEPQGLVDLLSHQHLVLVGLLRRLVQGLGLGRPLVALLGRLVVWSV